MLLKSVLCLAIVACALAQQQSNCDGTIFEFYNGFQQVGYGLPWDWRGNSWGDGFEDAFDGAFYFEMTWGDQNSWIFGSGSQPLVESSCTAGNDSMPNDYSVAYYVFNVTDTIQYRRDFYVPMATNWVRMVDTIINHGTEDFVFDITVTGNLGTDSYTSWDIVTDTMVAVWNYEGDETPITINWAGEGAQLGVTYDNSSYFQFERDQLNYGYKNVTAPAGDRVSIMTVIGQYAVGDIKSARTGVAQIAAVPFELYDNLEAEVWTKIINWNMCHLQLRPAEALPERFCYNPTMLTFEANIPGDVTLDGVVYNVVDGQVTLPLVSSTSEFSTISSEALCAARGATSKSFSTQIPSANISVVIDTDSAFPKVTADGGYGDLVLSWIFPSAGDFGEIFGKQAIVKVTDSKDCELSFDVAIPALNTGAPSAAAPSAVPVAKAPAKVSSGVQATASFALLAAVAFF